MLIALSWGVAIHSKYFLLVYYRTPRLPSLEGVLLLQEYCVFHGTQITMCDCLENGVSTV